MQIRAFDGAEWSAGDNVAWAPFSVSVTPNHAPIVTTANATALAGKTIALSDLFTFSDADNDSATAYELWDSLTTPLSGHFVIAGIGQPAQTVIHITAAQLAQTSFVTDVQDAPLQIRAFDGSAWSASDSAAWAPFRLNIAAGPTLTGDSGNNNLIGGTGNDSLAGLAGNDTLTGGGPSDTDKFIFGTSAGADVLTDFNPVNDIIDLTALPGLTTYSDLQALMQNVGSDVVITFDPGDTLTIEHTTTTLLDTYAADFLI